MSSTKKITFSLWLCIAFTQAIQSQIISSSELFSQERLHNNNPSLYSANKQTCVAIGYQSQSATSSKAQWLGKGRRELSVEATTFQPIRQGENVWGRAAYRNRRRFDVVWSENSDYNILYPYVMGDGRGGDLQAEEYVLHGGYNHRSAGEKGIAYGFDAGYRALQEYRKRDPRPNNTTADLNAKIGIALFNQKHTGAVSLIGGKYKQTSDLTYMNELGAGIEYHLTGLGNDYTRFSGSNNSTFYKGNKFGTQVDYQLRLPNVSMADITSMQLLNIDVEYDYFSIEKVLQNLNRLPLNNLYIHSLQAEASYQIGNVLGVSWNFLATNRKGFDNMFGDATGNVYYKIGSKHNFQSKTLNNAVSMYWQVPLKTSHLTLALLPKLMHLRVEEKHISSGNGLVNTDMTYRLQSDLRLAQSSSTWQLTTFYQLRNNINHSLTINRTADEALSDAIYEDFNVAKHNEVWTGVVLHYEHPLKTRYGIFVEGRWTGNWYAGGNHANLYEMKIGLTM